MQVRHRVRADPEDRRHRPAVDADDADVEVLAVDLSQWDAALGDRPFAGEEREAKDDTKFCCDASEPAGVVEFAVHLRQGRQSPGVHAGREVSRHDADGRGTRV